MKSIDAVDPGLLMRKLGDKTFEIADDRRSYYQDFLSGMIRDYNRQFVPDYFDSLFVICSNNRGKLIGGLHGRTFGGYLEIEALWVETPHHGVGIGSRLMDLAESEAVRRGCRHAQIDVYDFQALSFCKKRGYKQFASLSDYFGGHTRHLLVKNLSDEGAERSDGHEYLGG